MKMKWLISNIRLQFAVVVIGMMGSLADECVAEDARPNFIVIMGEAQGWASMSVELDDVVPGSKDGFSRTPNFEKLAASGIRFANFYAASPRCTPTRAALLTGKSPAQLQMTFVGEGKREEGTILVRKVVAPRGVLELAEVETTIAEVLRREGYATAHFGKWHLGRADLGKHGFEENDGANNNGGPENVENPNPKQAFLVTEKGIDFMGRQVKAGKSFYLQISHYPGRGGTDARSETYAELRKRAVSDEELRKIGAAAVREDMDATLGMLLAKVEALGIGAQTYIIYTADHGAQGGDANGPLRGGKGTVWEGGIRVPLLMRGPGIKAGACTHVRASTVDIFPTVVALAGSKEALPSGIEGGSLVPVFGGADDAKLKRLREEFVVHFPHYDKDELGPASAIVLGNYKLIRPYETGVARLFDLTKDRGEVHDLAKEKGREVAELERRLSDYLVAVKAEMPVIDATFDGSSAKSFEERRGGKGGSSRGDEQ